MSNTNIYDQHDKHFSHVRAVAIMKGKEHFANVTFKYPKDGAGRVYCYFHIIGLEMVRDFASGYGYDKTTAACEAAVCKLRAPELDDTYGCEKLHKAQTRHVQRVQHIFKDIGGKDWERVLRDAGYTVINVL